MSPDSFTRFTRPIRVGLLTPYFAFFDSRFPSDYRPSQEAYAAGLADSLRSAGLDVTASGLVDSAESAAVARQRFREASVEIVVAAATMAAPPIYGAKTLEDFDGPIVIWDDKRARAFAADVDEVEATRTSSILGSIMLANVLGRAGKRYHTVSTVDGEATEVVRCVKGAAGACALRGARLGLLGGTIEGYGDVILDDATAQSLGIELVPVSSGAVARAAADANGAGGMKLPAEMAPTDAAAPLVGRSLQVHRFLKSLAMSEKLDGLALNCHSDVLRFGERYGVVGCLASSLLWSAGLPVACTGDAATAVVLMLAARIAGSAQYCEGYTVESETGELVVSSCGMADVSLRKPNELARLCPNDLYPGRHGLGIAARFAFDAGPATIAAFGPATGTLPARLVISVGRLTGRGFEHLNGPSGTITFDRPGVGAASSAWIAAGPAHHLALMRGDRRTEFRSAATFLGIDLVEANHATM